MVSLSRSIKVRDWDADGGAAAQQFRTASDVFEKDLVDLVERKILALRISDFTPEPVARRLAMALRHYPEQAAYEVEPSVKKVGITLFDSNGKPDAREQYHLHARENTELLRRACQGIPNPVDILMQRLQSISTAGVCLERIDGRAMSCGVCRIFTPGSRLRPHLDRLAIDAPEASSPRELLGQLSANALLEAAEAGGEVLLWGDSPTPDECRSQGSDELHFDEKLLPAPRAVISPRVGDLLIFNSACVHAVRTVKRGERITLATFIGFRGPGKPWSFWS
jgi:hypothetical protein